MHTLLDSLTSRRVSLALMVFVAVTAAIGAWVPQRSRLALTAFEAWQAANPLTARLAAALGFDRIFTMWWFKAALVVFLLSVSVATWRMFASAWRRRYSAPRAPRASAPGRDLASALAAARAAGYREVSSADGVHVLWIHRVGLWAPAVMHFGMVLALAAAAAALAFTTRGVADLSKGEIFSPGDEYLVTENGLLGQPPDLGTPMRLDEMVATTWRGGELKTVTARLSFMDQNREWVAYESTANNPLRFRGATIYVQPGEFGDAAFVRVTAPDGTRSAIRLEFTFPDPGRPVYTNMPLADGTLVKGRWDPLALRGDKPLAIRIGAEEDDEPVLLDEGETVTVEGYELEFVSAGEWARLIVVRPYGIEVLFVGFGIIGLGSLMLYMWIPRQLVLAAGPAGGTLYSWRASRMSRAYAGERDTILGIPAKEDS